MATAAMTGEVVLTRPSTQPRRRWADGTQVSYPAGGKVFVGRVVSLNGVKWRGTDALEVPGEPIYNVQIGKVIEDGVVGPRVVRVYESEIIGMAPLGTRPGEMLSSPPFTAGQ